MIDGMPKPLPPRLRRERSRHGRVVFYVRPEHEGKRIRIRAPFGTPEFEAEYVAALAGERVEPKPTTKAQSLRWLWEEYKNSSAWNDKLAKSTRQVRDNIMKHVLVDAGEVPISKITRKVIVKGRDRRAPNPGRHFLDTMKGLFAWALDAEHVATDPTTGVKPIAGKKGGGFKIWSEEEIGQYEARWPDGTKERVWLHVLLYTGLRRSDAGSHRSAASPPRPRRH